MPVVGLHKLTGVQTQLSPPMLGPTTLTAA